MTRSHKLISTKQRLKHEEMSYLHKKENYMEIGSAFPWV